MVKCNDFKGETDLMKKIRDRIQKKIDTINKLISVLNKGYKQLDAFKFNYEQRHPSWTLPTRLAERRKTIDGEVVSLKKQRNDLIYIRNYANYVWDLPEGFMDKLKE